MYQCDRCEQNAPKLYRQWAVVGAPLWCEYCRKVTGDTHAKRVKPTRDNKHAPFPRHWRVARCLDGVCSVCYPDARQRRDREEPPALWELVVLFLVTGVLPTAPLWLK